jgi:uncharacterized membrane protein YdjX (TVP38/TMEM64 family)
MRQNKFSVFSKRIIISGTIIGIMLICALAWRFTPLKHRIEPLRMIHAGQHLKNQHVTAFFLVMGVYLLANLIMFPVTGLVVATLAVFGPLFGYLYALGGMLLSAVTAYGVGYALGYKLVQRWKGRWARKVKCKLNATSALG